ncbi:MAG: hypothetical protein IKR05_10090 [Prevotella sp.]|nr:hypothetical protein [Prevotella sp.]
MKKTYIEPKMKVIVTEDVMQITQVSNGYEQGVHNGEGTDNEARVPLF